MSERFEAVLQKRGAGTVVEVPFDIELVFGRVRAPVRGTVNGAPFRSTIMRYGGTYYLGLNKELRTAANAEAGDKVTVELKRDDAPREVDVPSNLRATLAAAPDARAAFEQLSYTHRKEYVRWIEEARREETRRRRVERVVEMLREGVKTPD